MPRILIAVLRRRIAHFSRLERGTYALAQRNYKLKALSNCSREHGRGKPLSTVMMAFMPAAH